MDMSKLLFSNKTKDEQFKLALENYNKTEKDLMEYMVSIKEWLKSQPHLPETPDDNTIVNFLIINKFSMEKTKPKLDMYYSIRSIIPELFDDKNPNLPHMKKAMDVTYVITLPKLTNEGYRVTIFQNSDENPEKFEPYEFFAQAYNQIEVRLHEDILFGDVVIHDFKNLKMGHALKITPIYIKKTSTVLEKVFSNRVIAIHFVNCPPYAETIITLLKQILKPKLAARINLHKNTESLYESISKEILPSDFGGDEISLHELNELWKNKLLSYKKRFDALDAMRTNEDIRPIPLKNDELLGFYGNFKKLDVD